MDGSGMIEFLAIVGGVTLIVLALLVIYVAIVGLAEGYDD